MGYYNVMMELISVGVDINLNCLDNYIIFLILVC